MKKRYGMTAVLLLLFCLLLPACSAQKVSNDKEVAEAIKQAEERYGTEFKLRKNNTVAGGALCDVTVSCKDLPNKEVRVLWPMKTTSVNCDYIYVKYGRDAYKKIKDTLSGVVPGAKIVIVDYNYDHFPAQNYDAGTDLETYLMNNDFHIYIYLNENLTEVKLTKKFNDCAGVLLNEGINCRELDICTCKSRDGYDSVKEYSYIPELMEYGGMPLDKIKGRAVSNDIYSLKECMELENEKERVLVTMK